MIVGELFAGIGGLGLGLERAGMTVKWAIENNPYACAVYRQNFPDVEMIEQDITTVDFMELQPVDLLTGGFPCQDISYAGKGEGIEGSRSGLWKEFWRAIRNIRPRLVLVENVPALLRRGLGVVLGDLAALGYDAEWDCIPAATVGAPHRRDRVFIVGYSRSSRFSRESRRGHGSEPQNGHTQLEEGFVAYSIGHQIRHEPGRGHGKDGTDQTLAGHNGIQGDVADTPGERMEGCRTARVEESQAHAPERLPGGYCTGSGADQWSVEPDVGRVADGVPSRVDRLRCLGNAVVPQVAEFIGRRIMEVHI